MTNDLLVYYDGVRIFPTPIVNYSQQPITFGYVYGYNTDISLDGLFTGIITTGRNATGVITGLTSIFTGQFKTLEIKDDSLNSLYKWDNVNINNISIEQNNYYSGSFIKYSVKATSYLVPSGVIDPSNEYSFAQGDDGTVTVAHKISARGVRNNLGAFQNAINFVKLFTGKDPFSSCLPYFIQSGSGVLASLSENIDRANGVYSVNETYRYNTGEAVSNVHVTSMDIDESIDQEFKNINYNLKIFGSPIYKTADDIINNYLSYNLISDIQDEFGMDATKWVKNTYSASVDSGAATIDIKVGYLSGSGLNVSGFFDYIVNCDKDFLTNQESWKVDGEFRCYGPLDFRVNRLNAFKTANKANSWEDYLTGLITSSPIYSNLHDSTKLPSPNTVINESEVSGIASLKLSLTLNMGYEPTGVTELKYAFNGTPNRWIYELLPSANIEGSFVMQDIRSKANSTAQFNVSAKSFDKNTALRLCSGYIDGLSTTYIDSGTSSNIKAFLIDEQYSTGTYDVSYSKKYIGDTYNISTGLLSLQSVGTNNLNVPLRLPGYNFGY